MPTKVQTHTPEPYQYDKVHEPPIHNKNWVHKEALQIALGSILTPKRPPFHASSRSTSGTLSPSHTPGTGTPVHAYHHAYHYPSRLSQTSSGESSPASYPSSPTAAKQPMSFTEADDALRVNTATTQQVSASHAHAYEPPPSPGLGPIDDSDPRLKSLRPTPSPLQAQPNMKAASLPAGIPMTRDSTADPEALATEKQREAVAAAVGIAVASAGVGPASGTGTPRAKFLQTLQGKGAWDALIHGSFS